MFPFDPYQGHCCCTPKQDEIFPAPCPETECEDVLDCVEQDIHKIANPDPNLPPVLTSFCDAVEVCVNNALLGNSQGSGELDNMAAAVNTALKSISGYSSGNLVLTSNGGTISWQPA